MDKQLARAVSNQLWPSLKRDRWRTHTVTRDLSKSNPHGYQAGPRTSTIATSPSANATVIIHYEEWIEAVLLSEEWPGHESYAIRLTREAHDHALTLIPACIPDYRAALTSSARAPFNPQVNRHGQRKLRRNGMEELITALAALALETIASAAQLLPVEEATIDAYLIGDEHIDLAEMQAIRDSLCRIDIPTPMS